MAKLSGVSCPNSLITHYGSLIGALGFLTEPYGTFWQKLENTVKRGAKYKWKGDVYGKNLQYMQNPYGTS